MSLPKLLGHISYVTETWIFCCREIYKVSIRKYLDESEVPVHYKRDVSGGTKEKIQPLMCEKHII